VTSGEAFGHLCGARHEIEALTSDRLFSMLRILSLLGIWGLCLATFTVATGASALSGSSSPRLWNRVTPAAGVPIRSAAAFRVYAISAGGTPSVDIYQINNDGSSTKLDTIVTSATGVYGAATYKTLNMAAIYWQFTTAPPASGNPPPVSVTFINDVPAVPLSALYYTALPQTPFAANDPSLLLNMDLRNGAPAGWNNTGSGTFDATNGYTPGNDSASGLASTALAAFSRTSEMAQGTVALRFQRGGVATDDSFGTHFWDSTGNTLNAGTQNRQLFQMRSNSGNWTLQALVAASAIPYLNIRLQTNSMAARYDFRWQTVNSHYVPGYQDPVFADLVVTWYQNQFYVLFDGHLVGAGSLGDTPIYQMFQDICIGNYNGTGVASGSPFGGYYIQQLQISSRFLGPVLAGPTIGLVPDSFAAAYTQRNSPTATGTGGTYQVSDIDAVQNALGLYSGIAALFIQPGQTAAFHQIQALMFQNYGFFPPIYNAGEPGHGYSSINAPMDDAYIAALNQAAPSIVVAGGTVNDVSPFKPADGNIVNDTEAVMRRLVLGGGAQVAALPNPSIEQIIYLETLSSEGMPGAGPYPEPAYATESQKIIAITRAGLSGFAPPNSVGFNYVTSREWWNQATDYPNFLYGSSPANPYNAIGGVDYQNVHPDATGFSIIASHLYGPVATAIMQSAGANVSISGSGTENGSGLVSYSVSIANAGPLAATGTVVSASIPSGATLVKDSSSPGCAQSGQTLTCTLGTIATAASMSVNIDLQAAPSTQINLNLSVSGGTANGGTGTSVVVSSGIAVPNVVGSSQATASAALVSSGLAVGTQSTQPSAAVAVGDVIAEQPVAGTDVTAGTAVNLTVSSGSPAPIGNSGGGGALDVGTIGGLFLIALGSRRRWMSGRQMSGRRMSGSTPDSRRTLFPARIRRG
jgi:uncharacterized repeat protein (TIGR01451 family)